MFNFFKSDKDKKIEGIRKEILLWHKACMFGIDKHLLEEPKPMVGSILFFLGSIDSLCKVNAIGEETFYEVGIELLDIMGFSKDFTIPILLNYYVERPENEFAINANTEGGKRITDFISGEDKSAPLIFGSLVKEWTKKPNLCPGGVINWLMHYLMQNQAMSRAVWSIKSFQSFHNQYPELSDREIYGKILDQKGNFVGGARDREIVLDRYASSLNGLCYYLGLNSPLMKDMMVSRCIQYTEYVDIELEKYGIHKPSNETKRRYFKTLGLPESAVNESYLSPK